MSQQATLLIVDDEPEVRAVLAEYFSNHGFVTLNAASAAEARELAAVNLVDAAVVDIIMPGEDGLSLSRHLRERFANMAILILSTASSVTDRIVGLEVGADDYLAKPFDPRELLARVKSVLRRTSFAARAELGKERIRFGRCILDLSSHLLSDSDGHEVASTPREFDLLKAFATHPDRVLSRERILGFDQARDSSPFDRSVDLRIMRLRRKIEPDADHPQFIRTIRSEGYLFSPDGGASS